jgi:PBSX family phage terminase large subunit
MELADLSPKQADFLINSDARINLAYGSVRSGKTVISLIRWLDVVAHAPAGANLLMVAKTERTLRRNLLDLVAELINKKDFKVNIGMGECTIYGRRIYLVGANDARSENKIRGLTLYAAYLDEVTLYPEDFIQMLLSRLSSRDAILIATTNPDSPYHFVKTKFIDRVKELNLKLWHFTLEDNLTLDPQYVDNLKAEYVPGSVYYKRYILGEWAVAEGAVFPYFTDDPKDGFVTINPPQYFEKYVISIDFGQQHPTTMIVAGYDNMAKKWFVIKEFYTHNKPVAQFSQEFGKEILPFCKKDRIVAIDVDPGGGGLSLLEQLRLDYPDLSGQGLINHAIKTDVATELQKLSTAIFNHELIFSKMGCKRVIGELMNYIWDAKAAEQGKDMPLKKDDDGCDATRYLWNRITRLY